MLKTLWFYGQLRKRLGIDKIQVMASSVKEALEIVSANYKEQLKPLINRPSLLCRVKGYDTERSLFDAMPDGEDDIHIYPMLMGSGGGGGLFKVLLGVFIIALAFAAPYLALLAGTTLTGGTIALVSTLGLSLGAGLLLGGAMQLMGLVPATNGSSTDDSSKYLGATGNTVKIGTPIAIIMGEILHYGQIISFNVDAVDVAI